MNKVHFCNLFLNTIKDKKEYLAMTNKIEEYAQRSDLKSLGNVSSHTKSIYVIKISNPRSRVIIEEKNIENKKVIFVRDIVLNKDMDRVYKSKLHTFNNGSWIKHHALPEEDITEYLDKLKSKKIGNKNIVLAPPPSHMTNWLKDFKLELNNEIFEMEQWVKFALDKSKTKGMEDLFVNTFRLLLSEIINESVEKIKIKSENNINVYKYENNNIGILFSQFDIHDPLTGKMKSIIVLYNGAHIKNQEAHWSEAISNIINNSIEISMNNDEISRKAFRSYPKWTVQDEDLWFSIENSNEVSNLSLTSEQNKFLTNFKFPYYINGQAGSGKSTMLYYLFSNVYYLKSLDMIKGNIIFLTENEKLLVDTKKAVLDLLTNNPEFDGLDTDQLNNSKRDFNSFKYFLLNILDEEDKKLFLENKYLNFSIFKNLYECSTLPNHVISKYSAEESWFTIITYIKGYDINCQITSSNYLEKVPKASRMIDSGKFKGIEDYVLPFYNKLIDDEGYWDKLKIIKFINDNLDMTKLSKYSVLVCDEAQDFCRVELNFILKLSEFIIPILHLPSLL